MKATLLILALFLLVGFNQNSPEVEYLYQSNKNQQIQLDSLKQAHKELILYTYENVVRLSEMDVTILEILQ